VPRLTALRRARPGFVALELDGRPWRTVPDDVVARAGLAAGEELDRPALRLLRAELVRARGLRVASRALARRDLSAAELDARLERARVAPSVAAEVAGTLERAGLVDDERFAANRAESLAARGWGDAAIAARLEAVGVDEAVARVAVAALEPEAARARVLVERESDPVRQARLLARRGFGEETLESVLEAALD
jgi:regulatory protein